MLYPQIQEYCSDLSHRYTTIPEGRSQLLLQLSNYIQGKKDRNEPIRLVFICTHNSRRSHFGQVWGAVAAAYYGIGNVHTYSGGTEATAFHPNAIQALRTTGFQIETNREGSNPHYTVSYGEGGSTICFSKVFDDPNNPSSGFAAVMTCSDAEQNCPFVPGTEFRIGITYDDPKAFDGTPLRDAKYLERSEQIATECLYVFSQIK
jgi:protein-tyrosine phosphatase/arsenate reductase